MDAQSIRLMKAFRDEYLSDIKGATILDVGASANYDSQRRCYRPIFEPSYFYMGMDVEPGINVDIVGYKNIGTVYDVVISGQVMEHVKRPWEWLKNLTLYFKLYICIIVPNTWEEHKCPIDTYRYYPDGMRDLFEYAGIKEVRIYRDKRMTVGIGKK